MHQDNVTIRVAQIKDMIEVERIERSCFEGDLLNRRSLRHLLIRGHCSFFVAIQNHAVIGYAVTLFRRRSTLARIYSIAVLNSYRGRCIAGRLLDVAETEAQSRGCTAMRLEVRIDNAQALGLYQGRGYHRLGIKQNYYEDGQVAECLEKGLAQPKEESSSSGQRGLAPKLSASV